MTSWAPVRALRKPASPAPDRAGHHAGHDRHGQVDRPGPRELVADPARRGAGQEHLASATDVEQRRPEGQADTEAGRDQRRGELAGLGERPDGGGEVVDTGVVDRTSEERGVRAPDRVPARGEEVAGPGGDVAEGLPDPFVGEHDEQRPDQHRQQHREERHGGVAPHDAAQRLVPAVVLRRFRLRGRFLHGGAGRVAGGLRVLGRVAHATAPSGRSPVIIKPSTSRGVSGGTIPMIRPR